MSSFRNFGIETFDIYWMHHKHEIVGFFGDYVFAFVSRITEKVVDEFWWNSFEEWVVSFELDTDQDLDPEPGII